MKLNHIGNVLLHPVVVVVASFGCTNAKRMQFITICYTWRANHLATVQEEEQQQAIQWWVKGGRVLKSLPQWGRKGEEEEGASTTVCCVGMGLLCRLLVMGNYMLRHLIDNKNPFHKSNNVNCCVNYCFWSVQQHTI